MKTIIRDICKFGRKYAGIIGKVTAFIAILELIKYIWGYKNEVKDIIASYQIESFISTILCYSVGLLSLPVVFREMIFICSNERIPYRDILKVSLKSNIMKYIPGNFMQYVGKTEICLNTNLEFKNVSKAILLEISITVLSGVFAACITGGISVCHHKAIFLTIPIVALFTFTVFWKNKKFKSYLFALGINILVNVYYGLIFAIVIKKTILSYISTMEIIAIFSISSLLGYITPGVPGGLGIREGLLVSILGNKCDSTAVLIGSVFFRLMAVLSELIVYFWEKGIKRNV